MKEHARRMKELRRQFIQSPHCKALIKRGEQLVSMATPIYTLDTRTNELTFAFDESTQMELKLIANEITVCHKAFFRYVKVYPDPKTKK